MYESKSSLFRLVVAVSASAVLAAISAAAEPPAITIGVISGMTGAAAKWNRFQNMGITLAQEQAEAGGFHVKVVVEDSRTEATHAIAAFNKLLDFDKVDALLADDFGFVVAPLLPLAKQRRAFLTAISLPLDSYCAQAPGVFYSATSQFVYSRGAFDHFFEVHPEVKKVALITFDDPEWGNTYRTIWTELAKQRGVEIVDTFLTNEWVPDFKSVLTRMLPKKPDAIFLAHEPESFFKAVQQLHYRGLVVSANNVFEMLADTGAVRPELEGVYVVDPMISPDFAAAFRRRFGRAPILEAYAGYEAMRAIIAAFKADRANPAAGMKKVSYDGVAGRIDFTQMSCAGNRARWGLFRFEHGVPQPVP